MSKKWIRVRDTYGIEIMPGQDQALILAIAVCLTAWSATTENRARTVDQSIARVSRSKTQLWFNGGRSGTIERGTPAVTTRFR